MTLATDMIQHAKEVRQRLMYPANAVADKGIDLHPKQIPVEDEVLEHPIIRVFIREIVKIPNRPDGRVAFSNITHEVSNYYGVLIEDMMSRERTARITMARHVAMYLARKHTNPRLSYPAIGMRFNRDHTAVLNAIWKIEELVLINQEIVADIRELESRLLCPHEPDHCGSTVAPVA
jgi:hypothetical protein